MRSIGGIPESRPAVFQAFSQIVWSGTQTGVEVFWISSDVSADLAYPKRAPKVQASSRVRGMLPQESLRLLSLVSESFRRAIGQISNVCCWFKCLLLVLFLAPRGFSPGTGTPVFPSPQKPTFPNSNSTRNQVDKEPLCGCATCKSLFILFIFIYVHIFWFETRTFLK